MRNVVKEAFSLHLIILKFCCLLPIDKYEKLFRYQSVSIFIILPVFLPFDSLLFQFTRESFDMNTFIESSFIQIGLIMFVFKFLPFVKHGEKNYAVMKLLEKPIFNNNLKQRQHNILNDCNIICKRCLWYCIANCSVGCTMYASMPKIINSGTIPTEIWLPFDNSKGTVMFTITYIYVCIATWYDAFANAAYDCFVSGLVYQAAAQIRILKDNLTNLEPDAEIEIATFFPQHENNPDLKHMIIENTIKKCLIHHEHIMNFVESYERYYTSGVFAQFLLGSIVICISVFELTITKPFSVMFYFCLIFTTTILFELFLYCYFGSILRFESETITNAIYMGNWYNYSPESKKNLLILMERSNKPLVVTAGYVLDLSLDTFTMIIRRAYSFYAVLRQYQTV